MVNAGSPGNTGTFTGLFVWRRNTTREQPAGAVRCPGPLLNTAVVDPATYPAVAVHTRAIAVTIHRRAIRTPPSFELIHRVLRRQGRANRRGLTAVQRAS